MVSLLRVRAVWSGFAGAPGYTVLHFRDFDGPNAGAGTMNTATAQAAAGRVAQFFTSLQPNLPTSVTINIDSTVDVIEDTTGELVDSLTIVPPAAVTGTATGSYAGASGAVVNWRTGGIRNGRRIRGRSFIVPLSGSSFSSTGTLFPGFRTLLATSAAALADNTKTPDLFVYARPSSAGASDGQASVVTGSNVPQIAAMLRSRRD